MFRAKRTTARAWCARPTRRSTPATRQDGRKLSDHRVLHVFTFAGERIKRMEVDVA
jgi:hypothetical protein